MRPLLLAAVLTLAMLPGSGQAEGECQPPRYGWKWQSMPIQYSVIGEVDRDDVARAVHMWQTVALRFEESPTSANEIRSGVVDIQVARAIWVASADQIYRFSVTVDVPRIPKADRPMIIAHELGHIIGFGHTTCGGGIMTEFPGATLSMGDRQARDLLYPVHRTYLPALSK